MNILNEIQSHTGAFKDGRTVTSILLADTEGGSMTFQLDDDKLITHMESLADQIITFENSMRAQRQKQQLPLLPVKPGQVYPNQG